MGIFLWAFVTQFFAFASVRLVMVWTGIGS